MVSGARSAVDPTVGGIVAPSLPSLDRGVRSSTPPDGVARVGRAARTRRAISLRVPRWGGDLRCCANGGGAGSPKAAQSRDNGVTQSTNQEVRFRETTASGYQAPLSDFRRCTIGRRVQFRQEERHVGRLEWWWGPEEGRRPHPRRRAVA